MSIKKILVLAGLLIAAMFILTACAGPAGPVGPQGPEGPAGPQGPAGEAPKASDLTCTQCHNDGTTLTGKVYAWEESLHGSGVAWFEERGRAACAFCHSGSAFTAAVAAGQDWNAYGTTEGVVVPEATRQDCRTCHVIHTTYTAEDFALRTVAPVTMVISGQTFDKGMGNLCADCHQARRYMANFASKTVAGSYDVTTRFNPHLSGQSDMLLGVGGFVTGSPSAHYTMATDSCVTCHMGTGADHSNEPNVATCVACHSDAKNLDINGAVTALEEKLAVLETELKAAGLLTEDGTPVAGTYDEAKASALWAQQYIVEDGSMGVHNMKYANALLDAALAVFGK